MEEASDYEPEQSEWTTLRFTVPRTFEEILIKTIEGFKLSMGTDKDFPAIEAIFASAYNEVPLEVWEYLDGKHRKEK